MTRLEKQQPTEQAYHVFEDRLWISICDGQDKHLDVNDVILLVQVHWEWF